MSQINQDIKKNLWIIVATVDFSKGIIAEFKEEALRKAQNLIDSIEYPEQIANIELEDVIKA